MNISIRERYTFYASQCEMGSAEIDSVTLTVKNLTIFREWTDIETDIVLVTL